MEYVVICLVALFSSSLTFFSGFGLGTILLPAFAIFFPLEVAIALTAIVHLLNNLFKTILVARHADIKIMLRFGIPALVSAFLGAWLLTQLSEQEVLWQYHLFGKSFDIVPLKVVIGILISLFALFEIIPALKNLSFERKYLAFGGLLSGFFGGLSGHQGALRSAFLLRCGLTKERFIGTGAVIACVVDLSRLFIYSPHIIKSASYSNVKIVAAASLSALLGALIGNYYLKKITIDVIQYLVAVMLMIMSLLITLGVL